MTSSWAGTLPSWRPHRRGGVVYSLGHLNPDRFSITLPAKETKPELVVEVRFGFSCHVFTRDCTIDDPPAHVYRRTDWETRVLCPSRYALSLKLPDIVRSLQERKCFFAKNENYLAVDLGLSGPAEEYRIFFDVRHLPGAQAVKLFVQSAYMAQRNGPSPRGRKRKSVRFNMLVAYALENKRVREPA